MRGVRRLRIKNEGGLQRLTTTMGGPLIFKRHRAFLVILGESWQNVIPKWGLKAYSTNIFLKRKRPFEKEDCSQKVHQKGGRFWDRKGGGLLFNNKMGISYHSCPPETVTHYILYNIIFSPRLSSHLLTTLLSASIFIMTSPSQKILPPTTFQSHVTVSIVVPLTKLIRRYADSEGTVVSPRLALFFPPAICG